MNRRRDEVLKEMGLWPVWRLRAAAEAAAPVAPEGTEPGQASAKTVSADHALSVTPHQSRATGHASPFTPHPSRTTRGAPVPPLDTHQSRATRHASSVTPHQSRLTSHAPSATNDARRARIMQMDWGTLKGCVAACVDCELHARRTRTVFGVGDEGASWLFVGEGPGADEDAQGEPFVGQAGKLLDSMLAAIKLRRGTDVYIANIVKCRPPGNRNPQPEEALACEPYLHRQIELIEPTLIVALGRVAALNLLARDATIASLRGRVHEYRGTPLIVTYHPAYLLRNLPDKAKAWADLCFAVETMRSLKERAGAPI